MSDYVAFSQITIDDLIGYIRLDEVVESERTLLSTILEASKSYVLNNTGRTEEEADTFPEMTIAVYALSQNMWDKRTYTLDKNEVNVVIDGILGSRSVNLL